MKSSAWIVSLLLSVVQAHGQFSFQRPVQRVESAGWYAIGLDETILGKLNEDFSDLRIYAIDRDTLEIPYLIKIDNDAPATDYVSLVPFNVSRKEGALFFSVKLGADQRVNSALLSFEEDNLDARVTVEGSQDQQNWFQLATSKRILIVSDQAISYRSTRVDWPVSEFRYLRFAIRTDDKVTLRNVAFVWQEKKPGHYQVHHAHVHLQTNQKQSTAKMRLAAPSLISKFTLTPRQGQKFYRNYRLERVTDSSRTEQGWVYYTEPMHAGVLTSYQADTVYFAPTRCHVIQLTIDNDDNPPIDLASASFWSPQVRAIAYLQPGEYQLNYGNPRIHAPTYDVAHFEQEWNDSIPFLYLGEAKEMVQQEKRVVQPWFRDPRWLWGALLAIGTLLGYFTVRMLRKS